jgi:hypothetical protein
VHTKNRGKSGKHVGDKKGKAADNIVHHESNNGQVSKRNIRGTPNVDNMQIPRATNNEQLERTGSQQNRDVSKRNPNTKGQHEMITQAPQQPNEDV